jgi:hypothetical protein
MPAPVTNHVGINAGDEQMMKHLRKLVCDRENLKVDPDDQKIIGCSSQSMKALLRITGGLMYIGAAIKEIPERKQNLEALRKIIKKGRKILNNMRNQQPPLMELLADEAQKISLKIMKTIENCLPRWLLRTKKNNSHTHAVKQMNLFLNILTTIIGKLSSSSRIFSQNRLVLYHLSDRAELTLITNNSEVSDAVLSYLAEAINYFTVQDRTYLKFFYTWVYTEVDEFVGDIQTSKQTEEEQKITHIMPMEMPLSINETNTSSIKKTTRKNKRVDKDMEYLEHAIQEKAKLSTTSNIKDQEWDATEKVNKRHKKRLITKQLGPDKITVLMKKGAMTYKQTCRKVTSQNTTWSSWSSTFVGDNAEFYSHEDSVLSLVNASGNALKNYSNKDQEYAKNKLTDLEVSSDYQIKSFVVNAYVIEALSNKIIVAPRVRYYFDKKVKTLQQVSVPITLLKDWIDEWTPKGHTEVIHNTLGFIGKIYSAEADKEEYTGSFVTNSDNLESPLGWVIAEKQIKYQPFKLLMVLSLQRRISPLRIYERMNNHKLWKR